MSGTQKSCRMYRRSLGVGVPPQRGRVGQEPGPGQVDLHRVAAVLVRLALRRDHPQLAAVPDDQPLAVPADLEPVQPGDQLGGLAPAEVEALQDRPGLAAVRHRGALAEHPDDRLPEPGQPARDRAQRGVARLRDRHAEHPPGQPGQVHHDRRRGRPPCRRLVPAASAVRLPAVRLPAPPASSLPSGLSAPSPGGRPAVSGANGDGVSAASGTRYGPRPVRERQVEEVRVIHRVEDPRGQEGQVLAVPGERPARNRRTGPRSRPPPGRRPAGPA